MFDLFNKYFYHGELTRPAITVSPDGERGAYGWCSIHEIQNADNELYRDICPCCGTIMRATRKVKPSKRISSSSSYCALISLTLLSASNLRERNFSGIFSVIPSVLNADNPIFKAGNVIVVGNHHDKLLICHSDSLQKSKFPFTDNSAAD